MASHKSITTGRFHSLRYNLSIQIFALSNNNIYYIVYIKLCKTTPTHTQTFIITSNGVKRVIQVSRNAVEVYDPALQGSGVCNIFSKNALRNTRKTRNCRDDMVTLIALRVTVRPFCLYSRGRQRPASSHIPCRGHSSSACGMTRDAAS